MVQSLHNPAMATNFDTIELEKENILPLKDGRSARRLNDVLQQDSFELHSTRVGYERRLLEELEDLDDPLELFLDYIAWINDIFPQGGTTKKSGLLDVIERCLMYFRDIETYKNDPRLLKLWLWYIELFCPASNQESKDIFIYMLRKRIGTKLALFYEEFSSLLFEMEKYQEAYHIIQVGIDENARPPNRLLRRLNELEGKLREMHLDIDENPIEETNFLEAQLPALVLGRERASVILNPGEKTDPSTSRSPPGISNEQYQKYEIFSDSVPEVQESTELQKEGWDLLESRSNRNKENRMTTSKIAANTNIGKLQQAFNSSGSLGNSNIGKLPIFKDSLGRSDPVYKFLEVQGKKPEKIDCNFNLIYPNDDEEYCIEEILALSRNIYHKKHDNLALGDVDYKSQGPHSDEHQNKRKKIPLAEKTSDYFSPRSEPQIDQQKNEYQKNNGATKTSILPLNDVTDVVDSESIKNREENFRVPNSPTVTYFSKDAMKEVYSMFNQNYRETNTTTEIEDTKNKFALFDNFTQEFTRPNMDDLTEVRPKEIDGKDTIENLSSPIADHFSDSDQRRTYSNKDTLLCTERANIQGALGAIKERTEYLTVQTDRTNKGDSISRSDNDTAPSSPFLTQPQTQENDKLSRPSILVEHPLDEEMRTQLLENIVPPLDKYDTFYRYNQCLKMGSLLQRIHRISKSKNKNPIVDFKKTGDLYCIRAELGKGGYATVYLAESSTGNLRALKVEKPASIWEYYILKQVEGRLRGQHVLQSIINTSSLHCFQDESYLVLNYANQGTILDLINLQKEKSNGPMDELLCMFITVELMKVVEAIHEIGIIHGDLKPDNCMIRFESGNLGRFSSDGSYGWSKKGIYLIDFGRSFDMTLLRPGTKFKADWKTDQQDCYEMRHGLPWSFEADYYGLAGIVHSMLFGQFIETVQGVNERLKLKTPFRRYWRQEIWNSVFDTLLNSGSFSTLPITARLAEERSKIEEYLNSNTYDKLKDIILDWETELIRFRK
ncbi:hypothetical protein HG535_0G03300 [Zygotorulaspora mrakii]|uniref:Protein kinase domain-containing protein n=1 Tax=Zygotorulaspora mrakii TaxID=42260 RepID=A0A7H9B783_ZYGMR|nr:uncharacterized protein HG535_0G03300 [Zygotorulaspora mrakii]QLG74447.1 hypothetical protein HG535_0G03300 [Zygotorulaspora mrakii]